jgi:hypothetical protein
VDEDDRRANAWASSVLSAATFHELRDDADELAALLADPPPLPPMGSSVLAIYKRLRDEHESNRRLRSRLRQMLAD